MRLVFLLCAAFALGTATGPVEELMDAPQPEDRPDESAALVTGTFEKVETVPLVEEEEESMTAGDTYCVLKGTNLASIHTKEDYQFIQDTGKMATGVFQTTWLGGSDAIKEGTWFWSDGSRFNFQLWSRGEPNNNNGPESCMEMNRLADRLWNDEKCELQRPFVCGTRP